MRDFVDRTTTDLKISSRDLSQYLEDVNSGTAPEQAWAKQAYKHGFFTVDDYEKARMDPDNYLKGIMDNYKEFATKTLLIHQKARDKGFEDIDSYLMAEDPEFKYSPVASEISTAHQLGMTLPEYTQYLQGIRDDPMVDGQNMMNWNADMYNLAKTYTDIKDGRAPKIDLEVERQQFEAETALQQKETERSLRL